MIDSDYDSIFGSSTCFSSRLSTWLNHSRRPLCRLFSNRCDPDRWCSRVFCFSDPWITATSCVVLCCVVLCRVVLRSLTVEHRNDDSRGGDVCSCSSSLYIFPSVAWQIPALSSCSQCLSKQALCWELKTETPCQDEKWRPQRDIHTQPAGGWSLQGQMWAGNVSANSKYNHISTYWHITCLLPDYLPGDPSSNPCCGICERGTTGYFWTICSHVRYFNCDVFLTLTRKSVVTRER